MTTPEIAALERAIAVLDQSLGLYGPDRGEPPSQLVEDRAAFQGLLDRLRAQSGEPATEPDVVPKRDLYASRMRQRNKQYMSKREGRGSGRND